MRFSLLATLTATTVICPTSIAAFSNIIPAMSPNNNLQPRVSLSSSLQINNNLQSRVSSSSSSLQISALESLADITTLSIDSGDIDTVSKYAKTGLITDATTNPLFVSQAGANGDARYEVR